MWEVGGDGGVRMCRRWSSPALTCWLSWRSPESDSDIRVSVRTDGREPKTTCVHACTNARTHACTHAWHGPTSKLHAAVVHEKELES